MKYAIAFVLLLGLCVGGLFWFQQRNATPSAAKGGSLTVYCAAGIRKPVDAVAEQYHKEFGTTVDGQYGGSGELLSDLALSKKGDLFIAADANTMALAREKGLVKEVIPLAVQKPVIAVLKGNPKNIHTIDDLLRPDVKFALANQTASIGMVVKKAMGDRWDDFSKHAAVTKTTVTDIANDVSLGAVDAAILWDATVPQFTKLETIDLPEMDKFQEQVSVGVLSSCQQPASALRFARYLAAPEKGAITFQKFGFHTIKGDDWSAHPKLLFYSGTVNRPALEKTLKEFADREGVDVETVYNGCGVLCASMRSMANSPGAKIPDAYYACDICFVPPVADLYPTSIILTEADIVIAVDKGNPKEIHSVADLAKPGLKVGICNAEQATLGYITKGLIAETGKGPAIMKNVCSQVPTADFLVNQLRTGSLDAVIVYVINAKPAAEHIDLVPINIPGNLAQQPFAVAAHSPNAELAGRMLDFMRDHKDRFEEAGFRWRNDAPTLSRDIKVPDWLKKANE